jgi:hypothetical protein
MPNASHAVTQNIMKLKISIKFPNMRFRINEKLKFLGLYFKLQTYLHHYNIILLYSLPFIPQISEERVDETWEPATNWYCITQPSH